MNHHAQAVQRSAAAQLHWEARIAAALVSYGVVPVHNQLVAPTIGCACCCARTPPDAWLLRWKRSRSAFKMSDRSGPAGVLHSPTYQHVDNITPGSELWNGDQCMPTKQCLLAAATAQVNGFLKDGPAAELAVHQLHRLRQVQTLQAPVPHLRHQQAHPLAQPRSSGWIWHCLGDRGVQRPAATAAAGARGIAL